MKPNKKQISQSEWLRAHDKNEWNKNRPELDQFSQEAVKGLQYQNPETSPSETLSKLRKRIGIKDEASNSNVKPLRRLMSIAAGFLILAIGLYFLYLQSPSKSDTFAQHFTYLPIAMEGVDRNVSKQAIEGLKSSAIKMYEAGNYQEAEGLFRAYLSEVDSDSEMQFYYGILLLSKGATKEAIPLFQQMRSSPVRKGYYRAASWYLALSYFRQDKESLARPLLEELINTNGEDKYAMHARALLRDL